MTDHKCDSTPEFVAIRKIMQDDWMLKIQGTHANVDIFFCPLCGRRLDKENHSKKSVASMLSGFMDISEDSAICLVDTLIEAVKHELNAKEDK